MTAPGIAPGDPSLDSHKIAILTSAALEHNNILKHHNSTILKLIASAEELENRIKALEEKQAKS